MIADWLRTMGDWPNLDPKSMHVEFERIHGFRDGNGRVGRLLLWLHQMWLGQPPTLLRVAERQAYYRWFRTDADRLDEYRQYLMAMMEGETRG